MRHRTHPFTHSLRLGAYALALLSAWSLASADAPSPTRLASPAFLQPPPGISVEGLAIAKTPPGVELHLFSSLPDGGRQTLWSSWGDGCVASNGKYYFGLGNHLGPEGLSFLYEYDPQTRAAKQVVNVWELLAEPKERYAAGKIHARIREGKDGWLYFGTYWGKQPAGADYQGGVLLRYDPRRGRAENLGAVEPGPGQGLPTSTLDPERMIAYFLLAEGGDMVAYDLAARRTLYRGSGAEQVGDRDLMLDREGNCYFTIMGGILARYSPETRKVSRTRAALPRRENPAETPSRHAVRVSTRPARDGTIYGCTFGGSLFAFHPKEERITELGINWGAGEYTAAMDLSPDERYLYYTPGSHGQATKYGTPVLQFDLATRQRKVVAFLNPSLRENLRYNVGGSYCLSISPKGDRLYVVFNGAPVPAQPVRREETFGQPALAVIDIPASER